MVSKIVPEPVHSFVQLWGETVIGDGCSILYRDGELFSESDDDGEADGYLEAVSDFGHKVQIVKVETEGKDWEDVEMWWSTVDYSVLQVTLDAFLEQGFTLEQHEKTS